MKWSKNDIERFKRASPTCQVISVEGNILIYSVPSLPPATRVWQFKARLTHGGEALAYTVHNLDNHRDLFE
jgi:hypothetical protein